MKWKLRDGQSLRMLAGQDESVVYNDHSGDTHLLSAIAIAFLHHLRNSPDNLAGICAALANDWEFESDDELQQLVMSLADELDGLGLIEPCLP